MAKRTAPRIPHRAGRKPPPARTGSSKEPNLLVTIDERYRKFAQAEVQSILHRLGIDDVGFMNVGQGLLGVALKVDDPKACVQMLQGLIREDPIAFQHTHRWIPVEEWHRAEARELSRFANIANQEIGQDESWRVQITRHGSTLDRDVMVKAVAQGIENPHVDLKHPDKTVVLEIVGQKAAMAVLDPNQQLSVDQVVSREFVRFEETP